MNQIQKIVVIITALLFAAMMLLPPFHYQRYYIGNAGYAFIFAPPQENGFVAIINTSALFLQFVVVSVVGVVLFHVFKSKEAL